MSQKDIKNLKSVIRGLQNQADALKKAVIRADVHINGAKNIKADKITSGTVNINNFTVRTGGLLQKAEQLEKDMQEIRNYVSKIEDGIGSLDPEFNLDEEDIDEYEV